MCLHVIGSIWEAALCQTAYILKATMSKCHILLSGIRLYPLTNVNELILAHMDCGHVNPFRGFQLSISLGRPQLDEKCVCMAMHNIVPNWQVAWCQTV